MHSIDLYSGSKKKNSWGVQFEILKKNPGLTFIVASEEMHSIYFYSGSKKKQEASQPESSAVYNTLYMIHSPIKPNELDLTF